jgi:hypothetical protein
VRTGHAAEKLAVVRRFVLDSLRHEPPARDIGRKRASSLRGRPFFQQKNPVNEKGIS